MENKNQSFIGFEIWFNKLKMQLKMQTYILLMCFICQCIVVGVLYFEVLNPSERSIIHSYMFSHVGSTTAKTKVNIDGKIYTLSNEYIKKNFKPYVEKYKKKYNNYLYFSFLTYSLFFLINYLFSIKAKKHTQPKHLRGARLVTPKEMIKYLNKAKEKTSLPIGKETGALFWKSQLKMPKSAEPKHTLIIGRPGTGKTVLLMQMLTEIFNRGDKCIIHDFKGDLLAKLYRPGKDLIFNPLDERSVIWPFFDEIEDIMDIDAVGYSLIPDANGSGFDPFWNNTARNVLIGIINFLYRNDMKTYKDMYSIATSKSTVIGQCLLNTPGAEEGATAIADPESKQTGSILSVLSQYTKIFSYMPDAKKGQKRFTIKEWLDDPNAGNIFITNYSKIQNTLAPVLALLIDMMSRELLSRPDNHNNRVFLVLEEMAMLPKMQSMATILVEGRSKGASVISNLQSPSQIEKLYGAQDKKTIINAYGSYMLFSVGDDETASELSRRIGEEERLESTMTVSMGPSNARDGISFSTVKKKDWLVLPSELLNLPDLTCYVRFPGTPVTLSKLKWKKYSDKNTPFVKRSGLSFAELLSNEVELVKTQRELSKLNISLNKDIKEDLSESEAAGIDPSLFEEILNFNMDEQEVNQ